MSGNLKMNIMIEGDLAKVSLEGAINEDISFEELAKQSVNEFVFDFEKVTIINSCGIREWVNFLSSNSNKKVTYINCRQIIVEQVNMIHGFLPENGSIATFYAPYYCEECDLEKKVLLKTESVVGHKAPSVKCDKCSAEMEFDALEQQYFKFIK